MKLSATTFGKCWNRAATVGLSILAATSLLSAEKSETKAEPKPGATKPPELKAAPNMNIAIPRDALGKEFLLSASIIPQVMSPTSTGLAGKIVRFELFHDGVDLYEATQGLVVTDELPARRLLTTFPIVAQDDNQVVIDFNRGMRRVFTDIWYGMGGFDGSSRARSLELPHSRVFEVKPNGDQLVIRQSAQARDRQNDQNREERYEIRYFITPYAASTFKSKEHAPTEVRHVRFFEVQPQLELSTGRQTTRIARFDIESPVVFYYSANTPEDYVEAVKEGILYWNRAFGKEVLKAEKAPAGVTAPDIAHNIIQWVPWESAGSAYADMLVDPRTGAAQRGQAYITSVFAISSKSRARELLRTMRTLLEAKESKDAKEKTEPGLAHRLGVDFLSPASVCAVDPYLFAEQLAGGIEDMLADDKIMDQTVMRASQDYVREVVAHEVGHILGLRHNFAGSVAGNLTQKELEAWFRQYMTNTTSTNAFADKLTSTSIMDYENFKARLFVGEKIRTSKEALPHDRAAIQWGYFDNQEAVEKKMLLGVDQDSGAYADVKTFDYGPDPVVSSYGEIADQIRNLPNSVIETFIRAKAPKDPRDRRPLEEVNLSVNTYATSLMNSFGSMLSWFKASTRSVKVESAFEYVGDLNRKEILQARWKSLNEQIDKTGGIDRLAFSFLPVDLKLELKEEPKDVSVAEKIDAKKLTERLAKLLEAPAYTNFVGLDEKTYSFTKEEKELIQKRGKRFFEEYEKEGVKRICLALEKANRDLGVEATGVVGDDDCIAKLERRIIDFAKLVITAKNDEERRRGKVDKSFVEVIDYKYDLETRLAGARALGDAVGSFKGWATDAKGDLNKQLKDEVEAALNIQNFKNFQDSILSRPLRDWYMNQQAVLALLPPKKTPDQPPK